MGAVGARCAHGCVSGGGGGMAMVQYKSENGERVVEKLYCPFYTVSILVFASRPLIQKKRDSRAGISTQDPIA